MFLTLSLKLCHASAGSLLRRQVLKSLIPLHIRKSTSSLNTTCSSFYALSRCRYNRCYLPCREFRTSSPRYVNPVIWLVVRPVLKLVAVLSGRGFRKWWKGLPPNKKRYFFEVLKHNRKKIFMGLSTVGLLSCYYYYSHLEEAPITKRKRFMAFSPSQFRQIGEVQLKQIAEEYKNDVFPPNHPCTKRVTNVVHRILHANKDMKELQEKSFTIFVINNPMENAFVLPNGEIFVFDGMLNLCSNNDQLGTVLAHEISHCILAHVAENFSFVHILDFAMVALIGLIWAVLPSDVLSLFIHWLAKLTVEVIFHLPYNRKIETEADEVGMNLAAKACFDIRESSAFWAKMDVLKDNMPVGSQEVEFLSTHPSHKSRSSHLDGLMEEALKLRSECGCPKLKTKDPRLEIERLAKLLEDERRKYRHPPVVVTVPPMR